MSTDQYTQGMGQFMDLYLNMQQSMNEAMGRYLSALNLPTRSDILALGERLSMIEDHIVSIEAAVTALTPSAPAKASVSAASVKRPPRTKQPTKVN